MDRSKQIVKISVIGIIVNVILVAVKSLVGLITGSIAVILDAVNNLSDALSSIITIIGAKLAAKEPDKKHPYGYGQIEYITSVVIAVLVFVAGFTSFKESIDKIINPVKADYGVLAIVLIVLSIFAKLGLGQYVKKAGKKVNSQALVAAGSESFLDALVSVSTLVAALITVLFGFSIEGFLGVIIALLIIKTAIEILIDSLNGIIGERVDPELSKEIKTFIKSEGNVLGAYDLILHRYGPERIIGSVHVEVPDTTTASEIHVITRDIVEMVYEKFGILLTVGIYASNNTEEEYINLRKEIMEAIKSYPEVLQMHGLFVDKNRNRVTFDLVVSHKLEDKGKMIDDVVSKLKAYDENLTYAIAIDDDFSD